LLSPASSFAQPATEAATGASAAACVPKSDTEACELREQVAALERQRDELQKTLALREADLKSKVLDHEAVLQARAAEIERLTRRVEELSGTMLAAEVRKSEELRLLHQQADGLRGRISSYEQELTAKQALVAREFGRGGESPESA
jgi:chromosome segregation ATPase